MEYKRFRWFFTSSGKLVIGGKNAEQNEQVIGECLDKGDMVLHTKMPGSPFCVVKAGNDKKISGKDISEAAVFCACFSQAWKKRMEKTEVHVFKPEQISKTKRMKKGTFKVGGKIKIIKAKMKLFLTKQKGVLRAVPSAKKYYLTITPGAVSKEKAVLILAKKLREGIFIKKQNMKEEIMQSLPAGGFRL